MGNFIYGLIPLAVIVINSLKTFIRFLDDGYLVFLAAALTGSIGIDVFMLGDRISGFASAFINICGYVLIVFISIVYLIQTDKNLGFNDLPILQVVVIFISVVFCVFIKAMLIHIETLSYDT